MAEEETRDEAFVTGEFMATILEFRAQSLRSSPGVSRMSAGSGAEIVFFPGVRYERWSGEQPEKPKPRRGRRRDTIDLED